MEEVFLFLYHIFPQFLQGRYSTYLEMQETWQSFGFVQTNLQNSTNTFGYYIFYLFKNTSGEKILFLSSTAKIGLGIH